MSVRLRRHPEVLRRIWLLRRKSQILRCAQDDNSTDNDYLSLNIYLRSNSGGEGVGHEDDVDLLDRRAARAGCRRGAGGECGSGEGRGQTGGIGVEPVR